MKRFSSKYPVFGRVSNDQYYWLCDNVGRPQKDWAVSRGAIWFRDPRHRTWYVLRWAR